MYDLLKQYTGGAAARKKLQDAAWGKIRKQTADKLNIPLHDADIILLLDDWFEDLKSKGSQMFA